jgi:putative nucleotidyltransferase with HDIG domain
MKDDNQTIAQYLQPEQLRVGIFVQLELSWFKHDFARSAFKIHSEEQLREVLNLRLPRYRYDPERSDAPAAELSGQAHAQTLSTPDKRENSNNPHRLDRSDAPAVKLPSQPPADAIPPDKHQVSDNPHLDERSDLPAEEPQGQVIADTIPSKHPDSNNPHTLERSEMPAVKPQGQAIADTVPSAPDEHMNSNNPHRLDRSDVTAAGQPSQAPAETMQPTPADLDVNDAHMIQDEQQRAKFLVQREQRIKEVEKAFVNAVELLKNLNRNLLLKPKDTLDDMGALAGEMVTAFLESPEVTLHVMGENVGGEDTYYHSLNVAILSMMLARDLGFSSKMARELGIGAMVHDIGLMKIPGRVILKYPDEYTNPERNLRAMHVEYGVEIGRSVGFSADVLAIIAQHHELSDGSGYPNLLKEAAMTPAARVVSLVNYYDNLCNPLDISKAITPHEALSLMFAKRRSKFEARALALLIRSLGVYPPGSIVQLSNEAVAVVISVNPKRSLRPCVLVYDHKIPKEKAIILNLEHEPEISITKSISPALLPPKVATYLNPRKRVTYFFDSDKPSASA